MAQGVIPRYNPEYCKAGTSGACQTLGEPQRIERYRCHCITIKKNTLGQCSFSNHITLQPFLVIFKQEWMDRVILHEIAHYKYKHHRKPFWDFLSELIGDDSKKAMVKDNTAMSPYYNYYLYLTKNK